MAINQNDYHYWEGSFKGLLPNEILGLSYKDFQRLYEEFLDEGIDSSYIEEPIENAISNYEEEEYPEGRVLRKIFKEFLEDITTENNFDVFDSSRNLKLFRSISVDNIEEISFNELGVCWTYNLDTLYKYIEKNIIPDKTYLTRFYSTTPIDNIDWIESFFLYINYSAQEKELRIYNSNKIFLRGYINIENSSMIEYSSYGEYFCLIDGINSKRNLKKINLEYNTLTNKYDYNGNLTNSILENFISDNKKGFILNFGEISGDFDCSHLEIISLEGAPQKVKGNFNCSKNNLTSLEGAPTEIGGDFNCSRNKLTSLKGAPQTVGKGFYCDNNQLTSLKGAPQEVGGEFWCSENQLTSLKGAPQKVSGWFNCSYNQLTSLEGAPTEVKGPFDCSWNNLTSLEGMSQKVNGEIDCSHNFLVSLKGSPQKGRILDFRCSGNQLSSLKGIPQEIEDLYCAYNPNLHSLEGIGEVKGKIHKDF